MVFKAQGNHYGRGVSPGRHAVSINCGLAVLEVPIGQRLAAMSIHLDPATDMVLLVDLPLGFALRQLARGMQSTPSLVVTDSPCPEYWEDLWELQPAGLVVGLAFDHVLCEALEHVARGERFRRTPSGSSLSAAERMMLRRLAFGATNRRIAEQLHLDEKTVRNTLIRVYAKLGVTNRTEAALYYWGHLEPGL